MNKGSNTSLHYDPKVSGIILHTTDLSKKNVNLITGGDSEKIQTVNPLFLLLYNTAPQ